MELDTSDTTMSNNIMGGSTNGDLSPHLRSSYDTDVVRLIGQHLVSLGLSQTVNLLLKESGLEGLDHPLASKFRQHILDGNWDMASVIIEELAMYSEGDKKSNINEMRLLLAEQKFLESIEDNQHIEALKCLRLEITPLTVDTKRIQLFSTLLMCRSIDEVKSRANWVGKGPQSRQELVEKFQRFIPALMMLPTNRLSTLLSQAVQLQRERCTLHITNLDSSYVDLKTDHVCSPDKFPLQCVQELYNHKTEVWFCKFSNDGTKLATGGLGGKVKIWDLDVSKKKLVERTSFECSTNAITCLAWCPNDLFLLACGEDKSDLWILDVRKNEVHNTVSCQEDESMTTCSWHLSGTKFAAASFRGNFFIYDLDGNRRCGREGVRVQCLSFLNKDPDNILAADTLHRIKSYSVKDMSLESEEEDILEEKHPIMSFSIDKEDRYIAVNLTEQGVHLWDYRFKTLLRVFPGVSQRNFTIHSSFSSSDSTFLASGSEDGKVYIYHIHKNHPVAILHGHSRCVNCVTWNPKHPELLVSVSDDRSVRLWGPASQDQIKIENRI